MAPTLYRRQRQILQFLKDYIDEHESAPTLQEIASEFHLSSLATVHAHLARLEKKGYIERDFHGARGLRVIDPHEGPLFRDVIDVPIKGLINGNSPIEKIPESKRQRIAVVTNLVGNKNIYCLQVAGDRLSSELLADQDILLVEKTQEVDEGDTIIARLADHADSIGKYHRDPESQAGYLISKEPNLPPREIASSDSIKGKVLRAYRTF